MAKNIAQFIIAFIILSAGIFYFILKSPSENRAVLSWSTDSNPIRYKQIKQFEQWLIKNGHTDARGGPACEIRIETNNFENTRQQLHAASGIASDIIDCNVIAMAKLGALSDITEDANANSYAPDKTYKGFKPRLVLNGRQYGFPANATCEGLYFNLDTVTKYGMPNPPDHFDFETFELFGKEFVERANSASPNQRIYFSNPPISINGHVFFAIMIRSLGLDLFNETQTACTINDPRAIEILNRIRKWTYDDRLFPSPSEQESIPAEAGYGGGQFSHLITGRYASIVTGRWLLIRTRQQMDPINLFRSNIPCASFPNAVLAGRTTGIFKNSPYQKYARYFLKYLASEDYSNQFIETPDALPPNPKFTENKAFQFPIGFENENNVHQSAANNAKVHGIMIDYGYFTNIENTYSVIAQTLTQAIDRLMSSEEATHKIETEVSQLIQKFISQNPSARSRYNKQVLIQTQIDDYKARGKPIPREWITNPFHLTYYQAVGKLGETQKVVLRDQ